MANLLLTTLTFGSGGNARPQLGEGWAVDEPNFVWSVGDASRLVLPRPVGPATYCLQMRVFPFLRADKVPQQRLIIEVNGEPIAAHTLTAAGEFECEVPEHVAAKADRLDVVLRHPDAARPSDFETTLDNRPLAIAFRECRLFVVSGGSGIPPFESDYLVPPPEMLFDGSNTAESFKRTGQGFTRVTLIARGRLQPNERVLDLGSGNGQKARVLAYYLNKEGSYEGLDIVKSGVEWCQQRYAIFPNFRFQHADVYSSHYNASATTLDTQYRLPFPDGDFDVVFLSSVFTHMLPDGVAHYIGEISRVLKPGGRCVATFFLLNRDSLARIIGGTSSLNFVYVIGSYRVLDPKNPSQAVALPEEWVREQFAAAGLRVAEATYGTWAGGKELLGAYQDTLISVKE